MKQNQKILIAIGIGVVILLNIFVLGWLLTDFFSGPNGPEKTVATTDNGEETTAEEVTTTEETIPEETTEEVTTEAPPVEQIVKEIAERDAKKLIRTFEWGNGAEQLGYDKENGDIKHPDGFAVEDGIIYILDVVNDRILVCEEKECRQINLETMTQGYGLMYQNGKIATWGKSGDKDVLILCKKDGSTMMTANIPGKLTGVGSIQKILEIGETYVVFELLKNNGMDVVEYRFDWVNGGVTYDPTEIPSFFEKERGTEVIGIYENEVFYSCLDKYRSKNVISRESETDLLYTEIDTGLYDVELLNSMYLSSEGCLYMMECFADGVEISEIVLNEESAEVPEESTQEDERLPTETPSEWVEKELLIEDVKTLVRTFSWGKEEGKLGYYKDFQVSAGPNAFVVEDNVIIIMDNVNKRIIKYEGDTCTTISLDFEPYAIKYQNDRIAVFDTERKVTKIYGKEGNEEISIEIPQKLRERGEISRILEIGDTYVVWRFYVRASGAFAAYSYDWIDDRLEWVRSLKEPTVTASSQFVELIGESGDCVYYFDPEMENKVYVVNRETENGRVYTKLDYSEYRSRPRRKGYISSDGRFYIMECFEDRVEISELTLE